MDSFFGEKVAEVKRIVGTKNRSERAIGSTDGWLFAGVEKCCCCSGGR